MLFSAPFFLQSSTFITQFEYFQHHNTFPIIPLLDTEYVQMKSWIMEIKSAWMGNASDKWDWIRTHLMLILLQSQRLYPHIQPLRTSLKSEKVQKFMDLIEIHYLDNWLLNTYADHLFISESYLNALCKKECGVSASVLIQERLILAAKKKLIYTTSTVKEIAFDLHFSDPSYFIRFFKKNVGCTPNVCREETLKEM